MNINISITIKGNSVSILFLLWLGLTPSILWNTLAVAIAIIKAIEMYTHDLIDNLGRPHTPWPLMHPFPIFTPNPTRNPDIAKL